MLDALIQLFASLSGPTVYLLLLVVLLICGLGAPIPEDITLILGGYVSYLGTTDPTAVTLVCLFGVIAGDTLIFFLGHKYGRGLLKRSRFFARLLHPERLAGIETRVRKQGNRLIFAARFMPGLRAPIFFSCGTLHVPYRVFLFFDGLAALISVPVIVFSVYFFGHEIDEVVSIIKHVEHGILIGILIIVSIGLGRMWWRSSARVAAEKKSQKNREIEITEAI